MAAFTGRTPVGMASNIYAIFAKLDKNISGINSCVNKLLSTKNYILFQKILGTHSSAVLFLTLGKTLQSI